jgi:hypothetical protein
MNKPAVMPSNADFCFLTSSQESGLRESSLVPFDSCLFDRVKQRSDILYDALSQEVRE